MLLIIACQIHSTEFFSSLNASDDGLFVDGIYFKDFGIII